MQVELNYSTIQVRTVGETAEFYIKVIGYIRQFDKVVDLGERVIKRMPLLKYREMTERAVREMADWEDIIIKWE